MDKDLMVVNSGKGSSSVGRDIPRKSLRDLVGKNKGKLLAALAALSLASSMYKVHKDRKAHDSFVNGLTSDTKIPRVDELNPMDYLLEVHKRMGKKYSNTELLASAVGGAGAGAIAANMLIKKHPNINAVHAYTALPSIGMGLTMAPAINNYSYSDMVKLRRKALERKDALQKLKKTKERVS